MGIGVKAGKTISIKNIPHTSKISNLNHMLLCTRSKTENKKVFLETKVSIETKILN